VVPLNGSMDSFEGSKKKEKLRDRTIVTKIEAIGDEPVDGPKAYYFLQDLKSPGFISALAEELGQPLDAIIRASNKFDQWQSNDWQTVKENSKKLPALWRRAAWIDIKYSDFKDAEECFEVISKQVYATLEKEKAHYLFYKDDKIVNFPAIDIDKVDLRYYNYLTSNYAGAVEIELVLALALEAVTKTKEDANNVKPRLGSLKIAFDKEFERFLGDPEHSQLPSQKSLSLIERSDTCALQSLSFQSMKSLGHDPAQLLHHITNFYSTSKYANFFDSLPKEGPLTLANIMSESVKMRTIFFRNPSSAELPLNYHLHVLTILEFEGICKNLAASDNSLLSLDDWNWFGAIPSSSFAQLVQKAKILRPEISCSYSSLLGSLLMVLKSPGPLGCFEYRSSRDIHIRSKLGFGLFNQLYDPKSGIADKETSMPDASKLAFEMQDRLVTMTINDIYLYPANGIIIKASETVSESKVTNTTIAWAENSFSYNTDSSPTFVANFSSGETISFSKSATDGILSFSDSNSRHYTFTSEGHIMIRSFAKSPFNTGEKETKRVVTSNGTVIKHFVSGSSQVLFPDGSVATRPSITAEFKKVGNNSGLNSSIESRPSKNEIELSREDFVTIVSGEGFILTEHSCGTSIRTEKEKRVVVEAPGLASISFVESGDQKIFVDNSFSVERTVSEGGKPRYEVKKVIPFCL
jgi:hypothetical protein